jgi:hypothetical protein
MHQEVKKDLEGLPSAMEEGQMVPFINAMLKAFDKDFTWASVDDQEEKSLADDIHDIANDFWSKML